MVLFRSFYEFVSLGIAKSFTQRKMPKEKKTMAGQRSSPPLWLTQGFPSSSLRTAMYTLLMRPIKDFSKSTIAAKARPSIFPS